MLSSSPYSWLAHYGYTTRCVGGEKTAANVLYPLDSVQGIFHSLQVIYRAATGFLCPPLYPTIATHKRPLCGLWERSMDIQFCGRLTAF